MSLQTDIIKLQTVMAEQVQTIEDLSQELYQQQKDIASIKADIARLKSDLESAKDTGGRYHNEPVKPPHY